VLKPFGSHPQFFILREKSLTKKEGGIFMKNQKMIMIVAAIFAVFVVHASSVVASTKECDALKDQPYGGATITSATMVPATGSTPAYCRVTATVGKDTDPKKQMDIEVWLPENWQKRFLHLGGGGFDGTIPFQSTPPAFRPNYIEKPLQHGFALAGSNGGHRAIDYPGPKFALDYTMAQDYAYAAIGTTLRVAKALIAAYYRERPTYSYFWGCSNGGRGAFNAAAKYPHEYDGVVAAAPSRNMPGLSSAWMEFSPAAILTPGKIATVKSASVAECDHLDGLKDGIISNPDECGFDPETLRCAGTPSDSCLTDQEIAIVNKIQSDLKLADGTLIYSRTGFGELNWASGYAALGPGYVNWLTFRNPSYAAWDLNKDYPTLVEVLEGAYACSGETEALATYLNEDGKLIVVHGTDDTLLSHYDTARTFYEVTNETDGKGHENAKLYMAAGVGHCYGGPGADTYDMISAISDWVENGQKPKTLLASKIDPGTGSVLFTRPLCEYPKYPQYKGKGDPNDAANFYCKDPKSGHGKGHNHRNQNQHHGD
jgi:feruloyl esterase